MERYSITPPFSWITPTTDDKLLEIAVETPYAKEQLDQGRDFCFTLDKTFYTSEKEEGEYLLMVYSLSQPDSLKTATVYEQYLTEDEHFYIHRVGIIRHGEYIDKLPETTIKVLDNEDQSGQGVLSNSKKINLTVKDLRLYDTFIIETTNLRTFSEKEFLGKDFFRYLWFTPPEYWTYGNLEFTLLNERPTPIDYKKLFFRDKKGTQQPEETGTIAPKASFHLQYNDYHNDIDSERETYAYIDFATQATWVELINHIAPVYKTLIEKADLESFAPDLVADLKEQKDLDHQIRYAIEYVQNHIRYIYNQAEMHGHLPQEPEKTYLNKQGDCKAKSVLFKTILDYLGIESEIILVNYRADSFLHSYLSSLFAFNHVIVKITHQDKSYYIDPTQTDRYGLLDRRGFTSFSYYLPIKAHQDLQTYPPFEHPDYSLDEVINYQIENNVGKLEIEGTYRFNRADRIRHYFKSTNKREIIDSWNNSIFYAMNFQEDRKEEDIRTIFKDPTIKILRDDEDRNEIVILYSATIEDPYYKDEQKNHYMAYWDGSVVNDFFDYRHTDIPYWHNFDKTKYAIHFTTDETIIVNDDYAQKKLRLKNKFFSYQLQKKIRKHKASAFIDYQPLSNTELPLKELEKLKKEYRKITDSCYGLGVCIKKPSLLGKLFRSVFK